MSDTHGGGCLCGAVSFTVAGAFTNFHLCHCSQCQRTTGTAHAANLFAEPDSLKWTQGAEFVQRYNVPGRAITSCFCSRCGAALPYVSVSGATLVVPAGSLDGPPPIAPASHIFWAERAVWYDDVVSASTHESFAD